MKAMIFAAGFGKRLHPITRNIPKALVRIKRRPMLEWVIQFLIKSGIDEIVINTHYLADQIQHYISSQQYKIPIKIIFEPEILGTGGGLYNTHQCWGDAPFFICNVDILCDINLDLFYQSHLKSQSPISLVVNDRESHSMLIVDEEDKLCGWFKNGEENIYREVIGKTVKKGFCGLHFFNPEMFKRIEIPPYDSIVEQYMKWIEEGVEIHTWSIGDLYWEDIGTPAQLRRAEDTFKGYWNYSPS